MKQNAQLMLLESGKQTLDQYAQMLQRLEDLSPVTTRNNLIDLRQFIARCERSRHIVSEDHTFTPHTIASSLIIRYLEYLQTTLSLPLESRYLFPSEKTPRALTGRAQRHLITEYAMQAQIAAISSHDLLPRFGYWMAEVVPLHRLAQIMEYNLLDTAPLYICGIKRNFRKNMEKIVWIQM